MLQLQTSIVHPIRKALEISEAEYCLCSFILFRQSAPDNPSPGWCTDSKQSIADERDITKRGLQKMIDRMETKGLLSRHPETGYVKATQKWYEAVEEGRAIMSEKREKGVNKVHKRGEQSSLLRVNKVPSNGELSSHHNIEVVVREGRDKVDIVVSHLNERCGTSYRSKSKNTAAAVNARLSEGFTVEDFKLVIDDKAAKWGNDAKMCEYLRPETLFCAKHFEAYLNAAKMPRPEPSANGNGHYAGPAPLDFNDNPYAHLPTYGR